MRKTFALFVFILSLVPLLVNAQINVSVNPNGSQLAHIISGGGVAISNVTINCPTGAAGTFTCDSCNLGLDSGIVLTSGLVADIPGPNNDPAITYSWFTPGDSDLAAQVGLTTADLWDACVLEFDIQVLSDSVQFKYVFGSEEYPDFVCSEFNDVFGFFISGPGITGRQNIAVVPGTTTPVSINTVNDGSGGGGGGLCPPVTYPQYFISNSDGYSFPNDSSPYYIQYNGFTTVLTASVGGLQPCQTYHLKLAISDVMDTLLDSGVFIQASSLISNGVSFDPVRTSSPTINNAIRGCVDGIFTLHYQNPVGHNTVVHFGIGGNAVNGTDYTHIADSVSFATGDTTAQILITPIGSSVSDTTRVVLYLYNSCSPNPYDSAVLLILDTVHLHIGPSASICLGNSVQLSASSASSYSWTPTTGLSAANIQNPVASPTVTTTYVCSSTFGTCAATDSLTITIIAAPFSVNAGPDLVNCQGGIVNFNAVVTGNPQAGNPFVYYWTPSAGLSNDSILNPSITLSGAGTYIIHVESGNCVAQDTIAVVIGSLQANISGGNASCFGQNNGSVTVTAAGASPIQYDLYFNNSNIQNNNTGLFTSLAAGTYTVSVTDASNCTDTASVNLISLPPEQFIINATPTSCFGPQFVDGSVLITAVNITDGPFTYSIDGKTPQSSGDFENLPAGVHQLIATDSLGCQTDSSITVIQPEPGLLEIYPTDTTINLGESVQLFSNLSPYPNSAITSYYWSPLPGLSCIDCPNPVVSTYNQINNYVLVVTYNNGCVATASAKVIVLGNPPVFVPNSFTPNGDGNNDIFLIYGEYIKTIDLKIFNRWGELVFVSTSQFEGWDGTYKTALQNTGVYVYEVEVTFLNDSKMFKKGSLTLLR